ncbi:MAG TPA: DUF6572 domain-containing protein [Chthoniobacterales bacterium]|nr:DUF6572 domain-containing protein [Chthoniobacterales bacterium]
MNVQRSAANLQLRRMAEDRQRSIGIIDVIAHDSKTDELVLVMNEVGAWGGSEARLHELQERFNTYVSFLLDGELEETHPELAGKRARIEVRCTEMPDARAIELLGMIRDQLAFQEIELQVVVQDRLL